MSESDKSSSAADSSDETNAYELPPLVHIEEADASGIRLFRTRRVVIAAVVAFLAMGYVQWNAPLLDHQNANFMCVGFALLLVMYVAYEAHRAARSQGLRWRVPIALVGMVAAFMVCFRLDGFSGEMIPNLKFRFAPENRMEWRETVVASDPSISAEGTERSSGDPSDAQQSNVAPGADGQAAVESATVESAGVEFNPASVAAADSKQFLGVNRNGVIVERMFDVPLDDSSVKVLWNQGIGEGWSSFAVADDRAVTMEQRDEEECVTCYRLRDGALLWIQKHEARHEQALGGVGPRSTPVIWQGRVYANGATGFLRCIDVKSGEMLWAKDLMEEAGWNQLECEAAAPWGHASSPLVIDSLGICIVSFGGPVDPNAVDDEGMTSTAKSLIALDLKTGGVRWKAGKDQFAYASPMLMNMAGQDQVVSVNEKSITGHVPESGKTLWSFPWPGQTNGGANCAAAIPAGANRFLIGKGYGGGSALVEIKTNGNTWEAEEIWWSSRTLRTKFNHACVVGDDVFALDNGSLQAADLATGDSHWVQPRRSRSGQGQVIQVDDTLVVQSEPGDVVFVTADTSAYREIGRLDALDSKTWNIPTVAGRHLLVRNDRQVICYLLPKKTEK